MTGGPGKAEQIVLLAGGMATRLKHVTETIPKSMLEVAGRPFVSHQLELIKRNGIRKVAICTGYLGGKIEEFANDGSRFGLEITCSSDGDKLLGTGGAILNAFPLLDEVFFVMYGDSYLNTDFQAVNEYFFRQNKPALMTVYRNDGKWDSSNVEFRDGIIINYDKLNENENMKFIDYGLGIFNKRAFDGFPAGERFDLAEVYRKALREGELAGFEVHDRFYEIGSFEGLKETDEFLSNNSNN